MVDNENFYFFGLFWWPSIPHPGGLELIIGPRRDVFFQEKTKLLPSSRARAAAKGSRSRGLSRPCICVVGSPLFSSILKYIPTPRQILFKIISGLFLFFFGGVRSWWKWVLITATLVWHRQLFTEVCGETSYFFFTGIVAQITFPI